MPWFSNPQRDSRNDIRPAQQALVYAGYPHAEAVSEVSTYLSRVSRRTVHPARCNRGWILGRRADGRNRCNRRRARPLGLGRSEQHGDYS